MEIKNRQKLLMIAAGVGVLLLIGDSFIYGPLVASWKDRSKRIADLRLKVGNGEQLIKRAIYLDHQWERMQSNALPSAASLAEGQMLKSFDRWERASGITRVSIKPQWKAGDVDSSDPNAVNYSTVEYRADYTGDMSRVLNYLYQVEHDPVGLRVDSVDITSRDDYGQQLSLGLEISGLVLNPEPSSQQP